MGVKDKILRQKAKKVTDIDKKILSLISDMKETLNAQKDPQGIGLAAPQVGKSLRIFITNFKNFQRVVINPKVLEKEKVPTKDKPSGGKAPEEPLEGCLSIVNYYGPLTRSHRIKLSYENETGERITEEFKGFEAQIVQHELDHLEGILFTDRLLKENRPLYKVKGEDFEKVDFEI